MSHHPPHATTPTPAAAAATSPTGRLRVAATRGCALLRGIEGVDPRVAEGLQRERAPEATTTAELENLLEEEKRRAITDPYQALLYDLRALHRKGNFKGREGEAILQRVRALGEADERTLDLGGMCLRDDFAELLSGFLRTKSSRVATLVLTGTQIGVDGATTIARAANAALERLQFSPSPIPIAVFRKDAQVQRQVVLRGAGHNHLDAAVIGVLVERESRKLERLDVSENPLTGPHSNVFYGISVLFTGLTSCPRIKEINLHAVNLRAEGLTFLANTINDLPSLEKLVLSTNRVSQNSFGDTNTSGVESFCNELWRAKKLRELSLADNGLDYVSCTAVSNMLVVNQYLRRLDLAMNPLSEAGAVQLSVGIKQNATLETIVLDACELGCEAVRAIADSIRKFNRTLQSVSLRDNPQIRSNGYKALVKCASVNPVLRSVDVNPGSKYAPLAQRITEHLVVNHAMSTLRRDFKTFNFGELSEHQRTHFIEKLEEMSEKELQRFFDMHVLEGAGVGEVEGLDGALSSLRYYSQMSQYGPLKRVLWVLEAGSRRELVDKRPTRKEPQRPSGSAVARNQEDDGDDDDIWDYPICF